MQNMRQYWVFSFRIYSFKLPVLIRVFAIVGKSYKIKAINRSKIIKIQFVPRFGRYIIKPRFYETG